MAKKTTEKADITKAEAAEAQAKAQAAEGVLTEGLIEKADELIKEVGKKVDRSNRWRRAPSMTMSLNDKQLGAVYDYLSANGVKLTGKGSIDVAESSDDDIDPDMSDDEMMDGIPEDELRASKAADELGQVNEVDPKKKAAESKKRRAEARKARIEQNSVAMLTGDPVRMYLEGDRQGRIC